MRVVLMLKLNLKQETVSWQLGFPVPQIKNARIRNSELKKFLGNLTKCHYKKAEVLTLGRRNIYKLQLIVRYIFVYYLIECCKIHNFPIILSNINNLLISM